MKWLPKSRNASKAEDSAAGWGQLWNPPLTSKRQGTTDFDCTSDSGRCPWRRPRVVIMGGQVEDASDSIPVARMPNRVSSRTRHHRRPSELTFSRFLSDDHANGWPETLHALCQITPKKPCQRAGKFNNRLKATTVRQGRLRGLFPP